MFYEQRKDDYRLRDRYVIGQKLRGVKDTELQEKETEGSDCWESGDAQNIKEYSQDDSGGDNDDDDDDGDDDDDDDDDDDETKEERKNYIF